jgi:hypothetical protein
MSDNIKEDLVFIKNELESLDMKIDMILDMLNNFTMMLVEENDEADDYDSDDSWVPEQDDYWNEHEDES